MTDTNKIRIAIVDDHPMVREGLRAFLQLACDIAIVAEVGTGLEAVELANTEPLDVILMDLVMPGKYDGIAAIQEVTKRQPDLHIIALTSFQDPDRMLGALEAGAISYLQKDVSPEDLLTAIRQAAAGRTMLDPAAFAALVQAKAAGEAPTPPATNHGAALAEPLTTREQEVLEALAKGLSNKEIAYELAIAEKTVKVHVSHILGKLAVYDRTQAILAAAKLGLVQLH